MNNISYDFIICDSNNWYCKTFSVHKEETYQVGNRTIFTGGIRGFLISFKKWKRDFANDKTIFYFLFDNPTTKSNLRQQMIDPTYKEDRKKRPKAFYRSIDYLRLILENYSNNIHCIYGSGYEADDMVPYVIKKTEGKKTLLISEDMDWSRLISNNVDQYMKNQIFTFKKFQQKYGFEPTIEKITMFKTIKGDKSDSIPIGVKGLRTDTVIRLVDDYKDIYTLFDNLKMTDYLNANWKKKFLDNRERLILNYQLVSFFKVDEAFVRECTSTGKYRPDQLQILYSSLGLKLEDVDHRVYSYMKEKELLRKGMDLNYFRPPDTYVKRK